MRHFSDADWLDFVREAMPQSRRAALEQHLQNECRQCHGWRRFWGKVCDVAQREIANSVPAAAVAAGEAIFDDWRLRVVLPSRARRAHPIFDSLLEPVGVGVRAQAPASRRIVHRWGKWTVDVRIDSEPRDRLSVTGQVLKTGSRAEDDRPQADLLLVSGSTPIAQTGANRFGEFQFLFQRAPELVLYIPVPGHEVIAIALPESGRPLAIRKKRSAAGESGNQPA